MTGVGNFFQYYLWWRRNTGVALLASMLSVAGCGSIQPSYYILTSYPGTPKGGGPQNVEIQTPDVAGYLQRDYIVRSNSGDKLHFITNAAWAEPLPASIARNLALDLSQRLPGSNVYPANSGLSLKADAIVNISVSRFAEDDAGHAEIAAAISIHHLNSSTTDVRQVHVSAVLSDDGAGAFAMALSRLLGQVADDAATQLRLPDPQ